jgi:hypothetical protein
MDHESLRDSGLVRAATDLFADLSDLIQKEIRLARAEIVHRLTLGVRGGIWMAAAGVLGFFAVIFVLEGIVFAIASTGIAAWLPISLKNAAKCDKWYQLQNHPITESLNAKGAREKLFPSEPRACRILSVEQTSNLHPLLSWVAWSKT